MAEPEPEQQGGLGTEGMSSDMLHHMVIQAVDASEERSPTVLRGGPLPACLPATAMGLSTSGRAIQVTDRSERERERVSE